MQRTFAGQYDDFMAWHWWFRARQEILEGVLRRRLKGPPTKRRLLSVGCGPADGLLWLKPLAGDGGRVLGMDADPSGALRSDPKFCRADGIDFVIGSLDRPPIAPASVDCVLALDVIEHLDDDATALRNAYSLVGPGGFLLVTVPALPALWGQQDVVSEHKRRYTATTLRESFARAGLDTPELTYFNTLLFPVIAAVRFGRRFLGLAAERSDFDDSRPGMANEILRRVFASERHLIDHVRLPIGVSLMATLERQ